MSPSPLRWLRRCRPPRRSSVPSTCWSTTPASATSPPSKKAKSLRSERCSRSTSSASAAWSRPCCRACERIGGAASSTSRPWPASAACRHWANIAPPSLPSWACPRPSGKRSSRWASMCWWSNPVAFAPTGPAALPMRARARSTTTRPRPARSACRCGPVRASRQATLRVRPRPSSRPWPWPRRRTTCCSATMLSRAPSSRSMPCAAPSWPANPWPAAQTRRPSLPRPWREGGSPPPALKAMTMHAMVLHALHSPLEWLELPERLPGPGQIRVQVGACGVCRTDLHVVDGELPQPQLPIIPGHEIVGRIDALGEGVTGLQQGQRVGMRLGLYGFGAAAHILAQVARWQGRSVFALTRPGDVKTQQYARSLGATWAGDSDDMPPQALDAAIVFAPEGSLVPLALQAVRKGGRVVCAGIHMSDIPSFRYSLLWQERQLLSVANLTRQDGLDFLRQVPQMGIVTRTTPYPLQQANQALADLRAGRFEGAAVLLP